MSVRQFSVYVSKKMIFFQKMKYETQI